MWWESYCLMRNTPTRTQVKGRAGVETIQLLIHMLTSKHRSYAGRFSHCGNKILDQANISKGEFFLAHRQRVQPTVEKGRAADS